MVSKLRDAAASRARLRAAAADEFAARGFAGATVDRIAKRAHVTKAMVYYHFASKAALYREILRDLFASVADRVAEVRTAGGTPAVQLSGFVRAINETALAEPRFPAMWLREIADDGRHLDETIVQQVARVLSTLTAILADGRAAGEFRDVSALMVQFGIVGPLLLTAATEPIRHREAKRVPLPPLQREAMVEHVTRATLLALRPSEPPATRRTK
jgi:TetR/AcrR family transcriptional regulator